MTIWHAPGTRSLAQSQTLLIFICCSCCFLPNRMFWLYTPTVAGHSQLPVWGDTAGSRSWRRSMKAFQAQGPMIVPGCFGMRVCGTVLIHCSCAALLLVSELVLRKPYVSAVLDWTKVPKIGGPAGANSHCMIVLWHTVNSSFFLHLICYHRSTPASFGSTEFSKSVSYLDKWVAMGGKKWGSQ